MLFGIVLSGACSDSDTDDVKPGPTPSAKGAVDIDADDDPALSGEAAANTLELKVTSASDWTLTVSDTRSEVEWITPSASGGKAGRQSVRLVVAENTTRIDRTALIRLSNREKTVVVTYTQPHYGPANLTLSVSEITVGHEAVSRTFTLKSDLAWSLTSGDESFCTVSPVRGSAGEYTVKVAITENTSESAKRETTLSARSGYETASVRIAQDRKKPELHIDRGISTLDDLCRFRDAVNDGKDLSEWKYNGEINLLADIDLSYIDNWVPIGIAESTGFSDVFNGNGFTISNATIRNDSEATGFFAWNYGTIKNLNLLHVDCLNEYKGTKIATGGLCGYSCHSENGSGGQIRNCSVSGFILADCRNKNVVNGIGGICGYMNPSSDGLSDCTNYAIVLAKSSTSNGIAQGSNIEWESCKNEGLDAASLPYELYTELFGEKKYFSKDEVLATITTHGKILSSLSISGITNPDILENLQVKTLDLRGCKISSLDLSKNTALIALDCRGIGLTLLNVAGCTSLKELACSNNNLETLDLSKNNLLKSLNCKNNLELKIVNLQQTSIIQLLEGSFKDCTKLVEIFLPEKLQTIGKETFYNCKNLIELTIPQTVKSIGEASFKECNNLQTLNLSPNLEAIENSLFESCYKITSLTIPESVASIGKSAFSGCVTLSTINLPNRISIIPDEAFSTCGLTSIHLPDNLQEIGYRAFYKCTKLTNIQIPPGVSSIGTAAFSDCKSLESIILPSNIQEISASLFAYCSNLKQITLPDAITRIGVRAFIRCINLNTINIPLNVTWIGDAAFEACEKLNSFVGKYATDDRRCLIDEKSALIAFAPFGIKEYIIPEGVTKIGESAFSGYLDLTSISMPTTLVTIGNHAFHGCENLKDITLPDRVYDIGEYAFTSKKIQSVIIPSNVKIIQSKAFYNCNNLQYIYCKPTTPPTLWGENNFPDNVKKIYVPRESVAEYKRGFLGWNVYISKISGYEF